MAVSLPPTPKENSQITARLLLDKDTNNELRWALLANLDAHDQIEGKSLLRFFCEKRCSNLSQWGRYSELPQGQRFPAVDGEPWPSPIYPVKKGDKRTQWPDIDIWLAAALVRNDPDPLSWTIPGVGDYFDWVVQSGQSSLIEQLLRKVEPAIISNLRDRRDASGRSALHLLSANERSSRALATLARLGWDVNAKDNKGATPLHMAWGPEHVAALMNAGADPFVLDPKGNCVRTIWIKRDLGSKSPHGPNSGGAHLADKLAVLDKLSLALDPARTRAQAAPAAFFLLSREKSVGQYEYKQGFSSQSMQELRQHDSLGRKWTLIGHMARSSLETRKSTVMSRAVRMAANSKQPCLDDSEEGVSNLAWLMAILAKEDRENAGSGKNRTDQLYDNLIEPLIESGLDEDGAYLHAWTSFSSSMGALEQMMAGAKISPSKEVISFELDRLAPTGKREKRAKAFLRDPMPLIGMLDKGPPAVYPFLTPSNWLAMQALSGNQPQACLQALLSLVNLCKGFDGAGKIVLTNLKKVVASGIAPDFAFPGAQERIDRIKETAGPNGCPPALAEIVAMAEKNALDLTTSNAGNLRKNPRL